MTEFDNEEYIQQHKMMSMTQISKMFNISMSTIRKWMEQGRIPYFRIERTSRFSRKDVEQFLKENYYPKTEQKRRGEG